MISAIKCKDETKEETKESKNIRDILYHRSDLSTFIVHLTKNKKSLKGIVNSWTIEARSAWGLAKSKFKDDSPEAESQKCVCFTETPLEYLYLMLEKIEGRDYEFGPYGVAITKKQARKKGVNPVWYVDITPGHNWLMPINKLIDQPDGDFGTSPISQITPFIEPMGSGKNATRYSTYRKEFWWEREWRHVGDFKLPNHVILICPDENNNHEKFENMAKNSHHSAKCIDPNWGLEKIIARLAGFKNKDIDIL